MKKKYRTIKEIKKQLSNFADSEEGNTIDEKLRVLDKNLFGKHLIVFQKMSGKEVAKFFNDLAATFENDGKDICKHIADVISYLSGETKKKPQSLAVAHACDELENYSYNYYGFIHYLVKKYIAENIDESDLNADKNDLFINVYERCCEYCIEACNKDEPNVLYRLIGNAIDIDGAEREAGYDDDHIVSPESADGLVITDYVCDFFNDEFDSRMSELGWEDEDDED